MEMKLEKAVEYAFVSTNVDRVSDSAEHQISLVVHISCEYDSWPKEKPVELDRVPQFNC